MTQKDIETNSIYLDACSTTPLLPKVIDRINYINQEYYGNPSSIHKIGEKAAYILEDSRLTVASHLNTSVEKLVFTSGATESIHLAIKGVTQNISPGRIVISAVEHPAVRLLALSLKQYGWDVQYWPVDNCGNIKLDYIDKLLSKPTKIVSVIWGQSEIGTIQPIEIIGNECRKRNIVFHTDATQVLAHTLFNFDKLPVDLLSASSHKIRGPKGVGILLFKPHMKNIISAIQLGGGQEFGYRAGTEPIALIAGFAEAIKSLKSSIITNNLNTTFIKSELSSITKELTDILCQIDGVKYIGNNIACNRLPNHISLIIQNQKGEPIPSRKFVRLLSDKGIYISTGSACSLIKSDGSEILRQLGIREELLASGLRISLGDWINCYNLKYIENSFKDIMLTF